MADEMPPVSGRTLMTRPPSANADAAQDNASGDGRERSVAIRGYPDGVSSS